MLQPALAVVLATQLGILTIHPDWCMGGWRWWGREFRASGTQTASTQLSRMEAATLADTCTSAQNDPGGASTAHKGTLFAAAPTAAPNTLASNPQHRLGCIRGSPLQSTLSFSAEGW